MKNKEDITKDFIDKINDLLDRKIVRSKREIVEKLEWNETVLSNVMQGRRDVPQRVAAKLFKLYGNENNKEGEELDSVLKKVSPLLLEYVRGLKETIVNQREVIELQREKIMQLSARR